MAGIYLSGGSGIGKTTFCDLMTARYGIPQSINVIRSIHKNHPDISNLPTNERQLIYAIEYTKIHHVTTEQKFISDRSLLNVLAFWNLEPEVAKYLGLQNKKPEKIILVPVPDLLWYDQHKEYFEDEIRISTYRNRAGIPEDQELSDAEVTVLFYNQDLEMFNQMKSMCEYLEWPMFMPDIVHASDFQSEWQAQAHNVVLDSWKSDKTNRMQGREVPIERYTDKIKKGGEENGTND